MVFGTQTSTGTPRTQASRRQNGGVLEGVAYLQTPSGLRRRDNATGNRTVGKDKAAVNTASGVELPI